MLYLPNNTYKYISPLDLRYNALLKELAFQSKEIQKLRERAASFNNEESLRARGSLKKIVGSIMRFRSDLT